MCPQYMAIGNGLLEFGIVSAEALGKAFLPVAAPLHSHEVIGRGQHEPDRKKYVVKDAHSAVAALSALCLRIRNEPAKEFFSQRTGRVSDRAAFSMNALAVKKGPPLPNPLLPRRRGRR